MKQDLMGNSHKNLHMNFTFTSHVLISWVNSHQGFGCAFIDHFLLSLKAFNFSFSPISRAFYRVRFTISIYLN